MISKEQVLQVLNEVYHACVRASKEDELKSIEAEGVWKAIEAVTGMEEHT